MKATESITTTPATGANPCVLRDAQLFQNCSDEQLQAIFHLGRIDSYGSQEVLFAEGEPPHSVYVILSGKVVIHKRTETGTDLELSVLGKGDVLGLVGMLDCVPRSASASAMEASECFTLDQRAFADVLTRFPELIPDLLTTLSRKIKNSHERVFSAQGARRLEIVKERYQSVLRVLGSGNKAKTTADAMQIVVDQICEQTGWPVGHTYVVDQDSGGELVSSHVWHLKMPEKFEPFRKQSDAIRFPPGVGLPGRILAEGKPLWVGDLSKRHDSPRRKLVRELGLKTCFGFPVRIENDIVAVLEFFSDQPGEADELLLEAITSIGTHLGRMMESKRYEEKLLHSASHDALTNLPNRILFLESLKRSLARSKRNKEYLFAVLFIDLDRFKIINDSLGHSVGDRLLVEIANRVKACLRPTDVVARFGGDEYAILLDGIRGSRDATRAVERIRSRVQMPLNLNGREVYTSASIGIALSESGYDRPEDLLRDADTAMYRAKAEGAGQYKVFDRSMHEQAVKLLQLENDLRRAVEREEFSIDYQPVVSLESGQIVSFEALLRWRHPERGLLGPGEFIQLAEETELIIPITYWILEEACSQLRKWRKQDPAHSSLNMSVNLSSKHLVRPDLLERITTILSRNKLSPKHLTVEITESQLMKNAEAFSDILTRLSGCGLKIAIDDFGTGYSSLSYLSGFPVHALKIDRSFVSKLMDNRKNSAIVRTIVSLGHNLGLEIIAEGVETAEQLDYLRELKCRYGQGYYFFRPMNSATAGAVLTGDVFADNEKKVKISRLRSFDLFEGFPEEELAEIALHCTEMRVPSGSVIVEQGQSGSNVYLMERGSVSIHRREAGTSQFLGVLEAPVLFGETAILHPEQPWTVRIKALMDLRLLAIPVSYCISHLQRSSLLRENLQQLIAERGSI